MLAFVHGEANSLSCSTAAFNAAVMNHTVLSACGCFACCRPGGQERIRFDPRIEIVTIKAALSKAIRLQKSVNPEYDGSVQSFLHDPQLVEATAVCLHERNLPEGTTMQDFQVSQLSHCWRFRSLCQMFNDSTIHVITFSMRSQMRKSEARSAILRRYGGERPQQPTVGPQPPKQQHTAEAYGLFETVLDSLTDSVCTLRMTTSAVDSMINMIAKRFRPQPPDSGPTLAIESYRGG